MIYQKFLLVNTENTDNQYNVFKNFACNNTKY